MRSALLDRARVERRACGSWAIRWREAVTPPNGLRCVRAPMDGWMDVTPRQRPCDVSLSIDRVDRSIDRSIWPGGRDKALECTADLGCVADDMIRTHVITTKYPLLAQSHPTGGHPHTPTQQQKQLIDHGGRRQHDNHDHHKHCPGSGPGAQLRRRHQARVRSLYTQHINTPSHHSKDMLFEFNEIEEIPETLIMTTEPTPQKKQVSRPGVRPHQRRLRSCPRRGRRRRRRRSWRGQRRWVGGGRGEWRRRRRQWQRVQETAPEGVRVCIPCNPVA